MIQVLFLNKYELNANLSVRCFALKKCIFQSNLIFGEIMSFEGKPKFICIKSKENIVGQIMDKQEVWRTIQRNMEK